MTSNQQLSLARTHRGGTSLQKRQPLPGFLQKLYEMVNDPSNDDVIRWSDSGDSFYVLDQQRLANEVLGNWFKHKNFTSFVRQLNMYGFHKITHLRQGALKSDTEAEYSQFENPNFRRGQTDLLYNIQRNKNQPGEDPILDLPETLQLPAPSGGNLSAGQILDINAIVNGISAIKRNQSSIAADLNELKNSNNMLWKEAMSAREKSKKHSDTINRILKFLAGVFGQAQGPVRKDDGRNTPSRVVVPQKSQRLMIEAGPRPKGKGVDLTEVQDEERGSQNRFSRERSPLSLNQFTSIETPASSAASPSVAPSEIFTPTSEAPPDPDSSAGNSTNGRSSRTPAPEPTLTYPLQTQQSNLSSNSSSAPSSLTTTSGQSNQDALIQSIFGQLTPDQALRFFTALSALQHPTYNPDSNAPQTLDANALSQLMPFDPTYDVTHDRNPDLQPQSNVPLLSPPSPALGLSSLDPLVDHSARLQQTYERASDNAPYDAVANSFNSLMQSLGVDTSPAEAESSGSQDAYPPRPEGASSSGSGSNASGSATAGAAFGAPPSTQDMDYDPDAFWAQFPGETTADYGDFADQLESGRMNDPSAEQLSAFLDEVASQSDGRASPVEKIESPIGGAHDNRKRKSDVAGIAEPTGASSKEQSGTKAKRKR